jgi:hypothetical protein
MLWDLFDFAASLMEIGEFLIEFVGRPLRAPKL